MHTIYGQSITRLYSLLATRQNFHQKPWGNNHLTWLMLHQLFRSLKCLTTPWRLKMQGLRRVGKCRILKRVGFSSLLRETGLCRHTKKSWKSTAMRTVRRMHLQLHKREWNRYSQGFQNLRPTWHSSIARSTGLYRLSMDLGKMLSNSMVTMKAESRARTIEL